MFSRCLIYKVHCPLSRLEVHNIIPVNHCQELFSSPSAGFLTLIYGSSNLPYSFQLRPPASLPSARNFFSLSRIFRFVKNNLYIFQCFLLSAALICGASTGAQIYYQMNRRLSTYFSLILQSFFPAQALVSALAENPKIRRCQPAKPRLEYREPARSRQIPAQR